MAKNILFNFESLKQSSTGLKKIISTFTRAGAKIVKTEIPPKIKRTAGEKYKEIYLSFGDSQIVIFRIKETGDIYQVLLNGKVIPLRNQEDHVLAIGEVVTAMESGRMAFQKKLARVKPKIPTGMKSTIPKKQEILKDRKAELLEAIEAAEAELAELKKAA